MPQELTIKVYEYHELSEEAKARVREQMFNNIRRGEGLGYDNYALDKAIKVSDKFPDGTPSSVIMTAIVQEYEWYRSEDYVQDCMSNGFAVLANKDGILLDELGWGPN